MNKFEDLPIGIDLGTTNSCIGVYRNGAVEIIPNEIGDRTTPSVVLFSNDEMYVGEETQYILLPDPKNKVYAIKRIIGRKFKDKEVQEDISHFSFKVQQNEKGAPQIVIKSNRTTELYSPEEISSKVLLKLKQSAENFLQKTIKKVVITVPAYFTENQKRATRNAGKIAGLEVIKIINEPTAAALAYGFGKCHNNNNIENNYKFLFNDNKKIDEEEKIKKILVFDLGGGTLDVTLLELEKDNIRVKEHDGIMHLGGEDFDNILLDYCIKEFKKMNTIDLNNEKHIKQKFRLKKHCEKAKIELTYINETEIEVENLVNGKDLFIKINRAIFENLCKEIFSKCLDPIKRILKKTKEDKKNIDEIVLVGGSTKIPKIQDILKEFFNGKDLNCKLNPDEAVAYGATIEAAMEMGKYSEDITLSDVCPFSLGVAITEEEYLNEFGLKMEKIINKGSFLPFESWKLYTPVVDYQKSVLIQVYEGENEFVKDNHFLGKFSLEKIPYKKKDDIHIDISFDLDENSLLTVKATIKENNVSKSIKIKNEKGELSEDEIKNAKNRRKNEGTYKNKSLRTKMEEENNYKKNINFYLNKLKNEKNETILYHELPNLRTNIEKFIDFLSKDIEDNDTLKEKINHYLAYLFGVYSRLLNLVIINNKEKGIIISNIKNYLKLFKEDGLRYCPSLISIFNNNNDNNAFGEIWIQILNYYLEKGKKLYNKKEKKNAKFYLEEILNIYKKYFLDKKVRNNILLKFKCENILNESRKLINILEAELIENYSDSYARTKIIDENEFKNDEQKLYILDKFREALRYLQKPNNEEEHLLKAIYLANIIKIEYKIFQSNDYDTLLKMINNCIDEKKLVDKGNTNRRFNWFNEILKYQREIEEKIKLKDSQQDEDEKIKKDSEIIKIMNKIDNVYNKGKIDFFYYILNNHKPNGVEKYFSFSNKKELENSFIKNKKDFLNKLIRLYNPQKYKGNKLEERKIHYIMQDICKKINFIYSIIIEN